MIDRAAVNALIAANRYLVLATVDEQGSPWATPLFFAPLAANRLCWVSSPDSRHSCNIAQRSAAAITIFDSTVQVGSAAAAYFDANAAQVTPDEENETLQALNARLPPNKQLGRVDLQPHGPMVAYHADLRRTYLLVRGDSALLGNELDTTIEV